MRKILATINFCIFIKRKSVIFLLAGTLSIFIILFFLVSTTKNCSGSKKYETKSYLRKHI